MKREKIKASLNSQLQLQGDTYSQINYMLDRIVKLTKRNAMLVRQLVQERARIRKTKLPDPISIDEYLTENKIMEAIERQIEKLFPSSYFQQDGVFNRNTNIVFGALKAKMAAELEHRADFVRMLNVL